MIESQRMSFFKPELLMNQASTGAGARRVPADNGGWPKMEKCKPLGVVQIAD